MLIKRDMSTELYWMLENPSTRNDGMFNRWWSSDENNIDRLHCQDHHFDASYIISGLPVY